FNRGKEAFALQLDEFINKPDFASISTDSKPVVLNPELVLTAAYFAQGKAGAQEKQNNEELRDLEEEMIVNLLRGKVFVPVQMLEGQTEMKPENMRFPLIKLSNGKMFQPVCSDNNELARFSVGQERIRGLVIEGKNIKNVLVKEADGVLLNPKTVKLAIPKMKL
ncbi:MAG: SseB family protein, partial [Lachnospiraceae bacterium]